MSDNSVIIIGAGLSGLAAGCFAQMNGYQSRIFEHHSQPGGVAAAWRRRDYYIDGGIHFVMGHKPGTALHELYRTLGIVPITRFVDLPAYGRFTHEPSSRSVLLTADLDQIGAALRSLSPADADIVDDLISGARSMQGVDMSTMGLSKPPELGSPWHQAKEYWSMRSLLKHFFGKYGQSVAAYGAAIQDPVLRACIENLFLPGVPVFFVLMVLAILADGEMGLIDGTCLDFVRAIEKRYIHLGGQITYRSTVEQILVKDDRAVGVRLAGGEEHHAGAVVAACDGHSIIYQMLGGRYLDDKIEQRYASWPRFRPLLMISYGVTREFPGDPPFATILLQEPFAIGPQAVKGFMIRTFNYSRRFAPPGKSVLQVEIETEWDHWYALVTRDRAAYDAEKQRVAAEVLRRLEAHYPGISSHVEVTDVATPYTTWRYTLNHEGAWEGWLMTSRALRTYIRRTLPGLDDLVMAGQWVMPGGGVAPCLYSGSHAIQLLCRRDRRPFISN
jgi:phytoene dehydrogenase-like protein